MLVSIADGGSVPHRFTIAGDYVVQGSCNGQQCSIAVKVVDASLWSVLDILRDDAPPQVIRAGDSLLMTASAASESTGTVHIAISGPQSASYDTTPTAPVEHQFIEPGTYTVEATYTGGTTASRSMTVTVLGAPSQPIVNALVATNLTVCVADQFRLSAFPDAVSSNSVKIIVADPLGTTNRYLSTTDNPVPYQFDKPGTYTVQGIYSDGAAMLTNGITVTMVDPGLPTVNVLDASDMAVRANDILSFIVLPTSNTNGWYALSIDGPSPDLDAAYTNDVSVVVDHAFTQTGTYTVAAVYTAHSDQSQTSGSITVTVGEGSLVTPACLVGQDRTIDIPTMPDGVVLDGGAAIGVEVATASNNVMQATLTADADGPQHVVARLGDDGPIIASAPVSAFTLFIDESRYQWADDRRHVESAIVADYLPSTVVIEKEMVSEDAYIDVNRTLSKDATANVSAMDPSGLSVAMILPDADDKTIDTAITVAQPESLTALPSARSSALTIRPSAQISTISLAPAPRASSGTDYPCSLTPQISGPVVPVQPGSTQTFTDINNLPNYYEANSDHTYQWTITRDDNSAATAGTSTSDQCNFPVDVDSHVQCIVSCPDCCRAAISDPPFPVTVTGPQIISIKADKKWIKKGSTGADSQITITATLPPLPSPLPPGQEDERTVNWERKVDSGGWTALTGETGTQVTLVSSANAAEYTYRAQVSTDTQHWSNEESVGIWKVSSLTVYEGANNNNSATSGGSGLAIVRNENASTKLDFDISIVPASAAFKKPAINWTLTKTSGTVVPGSAQGYFGSARQTANVTLDPADTQRKVTITAGSSLSVEVILHFCCVREVAFGEGGDVYLVNAIRYDDDSAFFTQPQWLDSNCDGTPDTHSPYNYPYPIWFVKESLPSLRATLYLLPRSSRALYVRSTTDSWMVIPGTAASNPGAGNYYVITASAKNRLGKTVGFSDRATIKWEVSFSSGTSYTQVGSTWNTLYVTLGNNAADHNPFQSVLHIGCKNGEGASTGPQLADRIIWSQDVRQLALKNVGGEKLYYYGPYALDEHADDTPQLVKGEVYGSVHAHNGVCEAWAELFASILRQQHVLNNSSAWAMPETLPEKALCGDWDFYRSPLVSLVQVYRNNRWCSIRSISTRRINVSYQTSSSIDVPMYNEVADAFLLGQEYGQNTANPVYDMPKHKITAFNGRYYDIAYAKRYSGLNGMTAPPPNGLWHAKAKSQMEVVRIPPKVQGELRNVWLFHEY